MKNILKISDTCWVVLDDISSWEVSERGGKTTVWLRTSFDRLFPIETDDPDEVVRKLVWAMHGKVYSLVDPKPSEPTAVVVSQQTEEMFKWVQEADSGPVSLRWADGWQVYTLDDGHGWRVRRPSGEEYTARRMNCEYSSAWTKNEALLIAWKFKNSEYLS